MKKLILTFFGALCISNLCAMEAEVLENLLNEINNCFEQRSVDPLSKFCENKQLSLNNEDYEFLEKHLQAKVKEHRSELHNSIYNTMGIIPATATKRDASELASLILDHGGEIAARINTLQEQIQGQLQTLSFRE